MKEFNQTIQATGLGMRKDRKGQSWAWSQGQQGAADLGHLKGYNYPSHRASDKRTPTAKNSDYQAEGRGQPWTGPEVWKEDCQIQSQGTWIKRGF